MAVVHSHPCRDEAASWMGHHNCGVRATKTLAWATRLSVFFILTTRLRA